MTDLAILWGISAERGSGVVRVGGAEVDLVAAMAMVQRLQVAIDEAAGHPGLTADLVAEVDAQWRDCTAVRCGHGRGRMWR